MNYFEIFNFPVSFHLDQKELKRRFYQQNRKFHPDFFTLESVSKKEEILIKSTRINEAYKVLSDFDFRLKYILELVDQLKVEGQNQMDQSFLMEMMDINEMMMDLKFSQDSAAIKTIADLIQAKEDKLLAEINDLLTRNPADLREDEWKQIVGFYFKRRYLWRLRENLHKDE